MSAFRGATPDDVDAMLALMRAYYAEDGYPFVEHEARPVLLELAGDQRLGRLWVACDGERVIGYLAVTLGFSLEYGGRDAFLDELVIAPDARGRGLGRAAVALAERWCREQGVHALHLEVEPHRKVALGLYREAGFEETGRRVLSRRLD